MTSILRQYLPDLIGFSTGLSRKTRPFFLNCEPTLRCNFRCSFCNIPGNNPFPQEADPEVMERRIEECYRIGCRIVSFTGGEPLMYSGIGRLVKKCHELKYYTGLVTNGLLLGRYLDAGWLDKLDMLAISFIDDETAFAETRDHSTAYGTVKKNIQDAVEKGLSPVFYSALTKDTLVHAEKTAAFAQSLGTNVYFSFVLETPREGVDTVNWEALKISDTEEAISHISKVQDTYKGIHFNPDIERLQVLGGFNEHMRCQAARTVISLKPDGSVSLPCYVKTVHSIPPGSALASAWKSDEAVRVREACGRLECCRGCMNTCMYAPSLIGHPVRIVRWIAHSQP